MTVLLGWMAAGPIRAQAPSRLDAAGIQLALKKMQVLASVLYVAAHPDDENTRLIAYLANGRLADAGYLAMTRGDGGQNLIGPEIGELLGVIRSQELLAARRIDGGRQFFTRARDFGYSKNPEETLRFWDREQVLSDVVRVFREFQPDVVITRFPLQDTDTHGHHTASAILARDAMAAAGDPKRFPEQLGHLGPWRPRRLLWNTSRWFYDRPEDFKTEGLLAIDTGGYNALLGESYAELAARSRSMHRSQGFGAGGTRGEYLEYLDHQQGEKAAADLFEGIDTTWGRVPGGQAVGALLEQAYRAFNPEDPATIVPRLLEARARLAALPSGRWTDVKRADLDRLIGACLGLYLEAAADAYEATPGGSVKINLETANRSQAAVRLKRVSIVASGAAGGAGALPVPGAQVAWDQVLDARQSYKKALDVTLPRDLSLSQPYWLREKGTLGMFRVDEPSLIGMPENRPPLLAAFALEVDGAALNFERPVAYKWTDPARGERYRSFEVVPEVALEITENVYVLTPELPTHEVLVRLRAGRAGVKGTVRLETPEGWIASPASRSYTIDARDATTDVRFEIRPPAKPSAGTLRAVAEVGGRSLTRGLVHIEHDHLPIQVVMPPAEARVVRTDLRRKGQNIGYVQGAGDQVPAALREIGYTVTELSVEELVPDRLRTFDAVVLGVRACNTLDRIRFQQPALFDYVKTGGTLIVQYTTAQELKVDGIAPRPLSLSHQRVSEETAEVRFLLPDHPVLNAPNTITASDFDGWVQERGLYFADKWDDTFQAVLSSNDAGEPPRNGGLLVARHGDGWFVYTGYSFFRQLPAGVPGAYRLFANLIALGN